MRAAHGRSVTVVNNSYQIAPWADYLFASDEAWWDVHNEQLKSFRGYQWTSSLPACLKYHLEYIEARQGAGLSAFGKHITTGHNSGYQAISLAARLGVKRIVLLGFDHQKSNSKWHWHLDHKPPLHNPDNRVYIVEQWIAAADILARDLQEQGLVVINCTRQTALTCFQRRKLSALLGEWYGQRRSESASEEHERERSSNAQDHSCGDDGRAEARGGAGRRSAATAHGGKLGHASQS